MKCLPDIATCLSSGGDERIALDARGLNRYGHGVVPRPGDLAFSSSTASTISSRAFAAVEELHATIAWRLTMASAPDVYADEVERLRTRMLSLCGFAGAQAPAVILAASGTDIHLYATLLFASPNGRALTTLTVEASETGSGVAAAMRGNHFAAVTAAGATARKNTPVSAGHRATHVVVPARDAGGHLRGEDEIEAELARLCETIVTSDAQIMLVVTDVSKTGLVSPSLATVLRLRARWPERVHILIDACQFRMRPETLRACLDHECLVALTGSKFLGGPAFCGMLLAPRRLSESLRATLLPHALGDYAMQADWPRDWPARAFLRLGANFGLLLRWHAALHEFEALLAIQPEKIEAAVRAFDAAVDSALDLNLIRADRRAIDRSALGLSGGWDALPTIAPLLLRDETGRYLHPHETQAIYETLSTGADGGAPLRLGQPVPCGLRDGHDVSALRLCFSARLAVEAARDDASQAAVTSRIREAMTRLQISAQHMRRAAPLARAS